MIPIFSQKEHQSGRAFEIYRPPNQSQSYYGLKDKQGDVHEMIKAFRSLVFACVHVRAKEVANRAQFLVKIRKGNNEFESAAINHPLVEMMENPNPYFTKYFLWYLSVCYMDLSGNSYWWVAKDGVNIPRALWPLPSQNVTVNPGNPKKGEPLIRGYTINWGAGNVATVPADEIVHLKHPDPLEPYYYGGSLVMRAAYEIDISDFIMMYQREFFANDAMPAGIVVFPNELDKDVRKAFEEQWLDKFKRKPGKVGYLEGGAEFKTLVDQKEMSFLQSFGINAKKIQAVFGVPDSKLMMTESLEARATAEAMDYTFQKETIDPLLTMIDQQLTLDLAVTLFDKSLVISHVSTIPRDQKQQAELDEKHIGMGKMTINEIRTRDGMTPVDGGDEILVPFNLIPLSQIVKKETTPNEPQKRLVPNILQLKSLNEEQKTALWKKHDRFRMRWEVRLSTKVKSHLNDLKNETLEKIRATKEMKSDINLSAFLFDLGKAMDVIGELMGGQARLVLESAFAQFMKDYELDGMVFAPNSPEVVNALQRVTEKTKTVPRTLHEELLTELNEGIRLNESQDALAERVSRFFSSTNDYRSVRIARTVSNYGVNEGNRVAAKQSKLFGKKTWVSMRDPRVRETHAEVDGAEVGLNDKFSLMNGDLLDVPGDPNASKAESVINCRCTAMYSK